MIIGVEIAVLGDFLVVPLMVRYWRYSMGRREA